MEYVRVHSDTGVNLATSYVGETWWLVGRPVYIATWELSETIQSGVSV